MAGHGVGFQAKGSLTLTKSRCQTKKGPLSGQESPHRRTLSGQGGFLLGQEAHTSGQGVSHQLNGPHQATGAHGKPRGSAIRPLEPPREV